MYRLCSYFGINVFITISIFNIDDNRHSNNLSSLPPFLPPSLPSFLPYSLPPFLPPFLLPFSLFSTVYIKFFSRIVMCLSKKYLCMLAESRSESSFLDVSLFLKSSQELSATVGLQVQIVIELCNLLQCRVVSYSIVLCRFVSYRVVSRASYRLV